jgi:cell division protein FtsB
MRIWKSKIFLFFLLALLSFILFKAYQQWVVQRSLEKRFYNLDNKIFGLKSENQSMEREIGLLQDKENLEEVARKLQVLKKPGEEVLVIPDEILNSGMALDSSGYKATLWQKIKIFFGF